MWNVSFAARVLWLFVNGSPAQIVYEYAVLLEQRVEKYLENSERHLDVDAQTPSILVSAVRIFR